MFLSVLLFSGDRLDTDILAGIQSEIRTVLVMSGVTALNDVPLCAYRPDCILPSVGHVLQDDVELTEPSGADMERHLPMTRPGSRLETPQEKEH